MPLVLHELKRQEDATACSKVVGCDYAEQCDTDSISFNSLVQKNLSIQLKA